jgi:hypothetical protein
MQHHPSILFVAMAALGASTVLALAETDEKGFVRITPDKVEWKTLFGAGSTPSVVPIFGVSRVSDVRLVPFWQNELPLKNGIESIGCARPPK